MRWRNPVDLLSGWGLTADQILDPACAADRRTQQHPWVGIATEKHQVMRS